MSVPVTLSVITTAIYPIITDIMDKDDINEYDSIQLENHKCTTKHKHENNDIFTWCGNLNKCSYFTKVRYVVKNSYNNWSNLKLNEDTSQRKSGLFYAKEDPIIRKKIKFATTTDMSMFTEDDIQNFESVNIENHECVRRCGLFNPPYSYTWCGRVNGECKYIEGRRWQQEEQQKENVRVGKLIKAGHKCISILESYPSQHTWCRQEVCIKNQN